MNSRQLRIIVPALAILLATSACNEDSGSEAATVNDVYTALNTGTPDYECDYIPAGARCWLFTDETERATNIGITSEGGDPDAPVAAIFGGAEADPATVQTVAATLGVPIDDSLWIGGVGFVYSTAEPNEPIS